MSEVSTSLLIQSTLMQVGAVGIAITAVGLTLWLDSLHILIPAESLDLSKGTPAALNLAAKTAIDSLCWGTLSNSASILAQRFAAGDSPNKGRKFWADAILGVMVSDLFFWPAWSAGAFLFVPPQLQVLSQSAESPFDSMYAVTSGQYQRNAFLRSVHVSNKREYFLTGCWLFAGQHRLECLSRRD